MIDWPIIFGAAGLASTVWVQIAAWNSHQRRQAAFETKVEGQMVQQAKDMAEVKGEVRNLAGAVNSLTTAVAVGTNQLHDMDRRMTAVEGK